MDAETKQMILALQEQLKKGEITADEYTIAVTRLTDPEKAAEMESDYLVSSLPDYSFQDDDVIDDDDDLDEGAPPPVPGELTGIYGTRKSTESPEMTRAKRITLVTVLATVLVIFVISILTIVAIWAMILD